MKLVKRFLLLLIFLLLFLLAARFAVLNPAPVSVNFLFGSHEMALASALLAAFVGGALVGGLIMLGSTLGARLALVRERRLRRRAEQRLQQAVSKPNDSSPA